jgi:hypothetical protein
MREHPTLRAQRHRDELLKLIQSKSKTLMQISEELNMSYKTVAHYIKMLLKDSLIHISGWTEQHSDRVTWVKTYSAGFGSGVMPERPLTLKSVSAKRTRERMLSGTQIYEKSEEDIFKREKTVIFIPVVRQSWFSLLECV